MNKITILKIKSSGMEKENLRAIGSAWQKDAKRLGGSARAVCEGETLVVAIENLSEAGIRSCCDTWEKSIKQMGFDYECTRIERKIPGALSDAALAANEVADHRLTRRFLMSLPDDAFVVSNLTDDAKSPLIAEQVGGLRGRVHLWERFKAVGADQHKVHVVYSEEEFAKMKFGLNRWQGY